MRDELHMEGISQVRRDRRLYLVLHGVGQPPAWEPAQSINKARHVCIHGEDGPPHRIHQDTSSRLLPDPGKGDEKSLSFLVGQRS